MPRNCRVKTNFRQRMVGEQKIVWNTEVYIQARKLMGRKGFGELRRAKPGLTRCASVNFAGFIGGVLRIESLRFDSVLRKGRFGALPRHR
jgi:hypothetical protein